MIDQDTLNQEPYHVSGIAAHEETKRKLTETSRQLKIIRDSNIRLVRESSELIRDAIQSKRELASTQAQLEEAIKISIDFKELANKVITEQETTQAQLREAVGLLRDVTDNTYEFEPWWYDSIGAFLGRYDRKKERAE